MEAIHQGALWHGSRLVECKQCAPASATAGCRWCQEHRGVFELEAPHHALWSCPRHETDDRPEVQNSQHLCEVAELGACSVPVLWHRGLLPQAAVDEAFGGAAAWDPGSFLCCAPLPGLDGTLPLGPLNEAPDDEIIQLAPGAIAATDGSGGIFPTDRLRRRVILAS